MIHEQVAGNWIGLVADVDRENSHPAILIRTSLQLVKENTNVQLAERKCRGKSDVALDQGRGVGELSGLVRLGLRLRLQLQLLLLLLELLQHRLHCCGNGGCNGVGVHLGGFFFGCSLSSSSRDGENLLVVSTFEVDAKMGVGYFAVGSVRDSAA